MANTIKKLHPYKTIKTIVVDQDSPKGWRYQTHIIKGK